MCFLLNECDLLLQAFGDVVERVGVRFEFLDAVEAAFDFSIDHGV